MSDVEKKTDWNWFEQGCGIVMWLVVALAVLQLLDWIIGVVIHIAEVLH